MISLRVLGTHAPKFGPTGKLRLMRRGAWLVGPDRSNLFPVSRGPSRMGDTPINDLMPEKIKGQRPPKFAKIFGNFSANGASGALSRRLARAPRTEGALYTMRTPVKLLIDVNCK